MKKSLPASRLTFIDLVNAIIADSDTRTTLERTVPPAELTRLLRGEAVSADIPLKILSALDWRPQEVEELLASLPDIPVIKEELERGSLSIANSSTNPAPTASTRPGKLATLWFDPATSKLESYDTHRPEETYVNDAFIASHLAGARWLAQFEPDFVEEALQKIRAAANGSAPQNTWGISSLGAPARSCFVRQGSLIRVDYSVVPAHVVPIGRRWNYATVLRGRATLTYHPNTE